MIMRPLLIVRAISFIALFTVGRNWIEYQGGREVDTIIATKIGLENLGTAFVVMIVLQIFLEILSVVMEYFEIHPIKFVVEKIGDRIDHAKGKMK